MSLFLLTYPSDTSLLTLTLPSSLLTHLCIFEHSPCIHTLCILASPSPSSEHISLLLPALSSPSALYPSQAPSRFYDLEFLSFPSWLHLTSSMMPLINPRFGGVPLPRQSRPSPHPMKVILALERRRPLGRRWESPLIHPPNLPHPSSSRLVIPPRRLQRSNPYLQLPLPLHRPRLPLCLRLVEVGYLGLITHFQHLSNLPPPPPSSPSFPRRLR